MFIFSWILHFLDRFWNKQSHWSCFCWRLNKGDEQKVKQTDNALHMERKSSRVGWGWGVVCLLFRGRKRGVTILLNFFTEVCFPCVMVCSWGHVQKICILVQDSLRVFVEVCFACGDGQFLERVEVCGGMISFVMIDSCFYRYVNSFVLLDSWVFRQMLFFFSKWQLNICT